jgi:AI-2 transport system permease protein
MSQISVSVFHFLRKHREFRTFGFLIALFVIVGIFNASYLTPDNMENSVRSSVVYIIMATGMTFVLLTGNIDISVGGVLGLSAAVSATIVRNGGSIVTAFVAVIVIGLIIGLLNGLGVSVLKIQSFILTLGMNEVLRVVQVIFQGGRNVEGLPTSFQRITQHEILGVSTLSIVVILLVIGIHLFLSMNRKGRYFAAIGDKEEGAVLAGIPVKRYKIYAFMMSSVCAAIAGLIFASRIGNNIPTTAGLGYEMTVIAACVLGGVSLAGGVGSVLGATIGAIFMTSISSALVFLKVDAFWKDVISGSLLILIVVFDMLLIHRNNQKAKKQRLNARVLEIRKEM